MILLGLVFPLIKCSKNNGGRGHFPAETYRFSISSTVILTESLSDTRS